MDQIQPFPIEEGGAAVASSVNYLEADRPPQAFVHSMQFMGLVYGHLMVLVPVYEEQGRIGCVGMKHRAGQFGLCGEFFGGTP